MPACGGRIPMSPEVRRAGQLCFELSLPWEIRKAAVRFAFFAPGNDPTPWKDGWYPQTSRLQGASAAEPVSAYWAGGGVAKALVIQGLQDASAVPGNAHLFKGEFPIACSWWKSTMQRMRCCPSSPGVSPRRH
jgi:hypothetical protein